VIGSGFQADGYQIPGHHFPPIIIASLLIYLIAIYVYSDAFYEAKRSLEEAFPAANNNSNGAVADNKEDEATLIGQSDIPAEPIIGPVDRSFLKTVILGVPDWNEVDFSYFTIGFNILLAFLALDLVFRGPLLYPSSGVRFSRVGYVDSSSAKILIREPDTSQYPIYVYLKAHDTGRWTKDDTIFYTDEETDYTHPITFEALSPDKRYTYEFSNNLTGTFKTAPSESRPNPANDKLAFLTSSCIKANFPYSPFNHALSIPGFKHLSTVIQSLPSPAAFILFLGDFIYVDVPLRLSSTTSHYRAEYRRIYASPSWQLPGISSVPWLHTLDDHEIANDWSSGNETDPFPSAADPFVHYHVSVNPPTPPGTPSISIDNTTYFQFMRGPAEFFLLDTRRYRTAPEPVSQSQSLTAKPISTIAIPQSTSWFSTRNSSSSPSYTHLHSILGHTQLTALLTFLATPSPPHVHWKIITSSVPFTKNWRFGISDTWGGFPTERQIVLDAMHAAEAHLGVRVVVLSGDRHEFGAVRFPAPVESGANTTSEEGESPHYDPTPHSGPHEFSVSPLSMFYLPIRTFRQIDGQDVTIKYLPDGNSKVGVVELENLKGGGVQRSQLRYTLWVDGVVAWEYLLTSPGTGFEGYREERGWGGGWF
jgi:alkaline phosphatase D